MPDDAVVSIEGWEASLRLGKLKYATDRIKISHNGGASFDFSLGSIKDSKKSD